MIPMPEPEKLSPAFVNAIKNASVGELKGRLQRRKTAILELLESDTELTKKDRLFAANILRAVDVDIQDKGGRPRARNGLSHSAAMIANRMNEDWKRENSTKRIPGSKLDEHIEAALRKVQSWFPDEEQPNYHQVFKLLANPGRWQKAPPGVPISQTEIQNLFEGFGDDLDPDV